MPNSDDIKFKKFKETLPDNIKNTNEETYNLRGYWEALGKPEEFDYSQPKETDGAYHAFSRNPQTGEILKKENHPTFKMAIEGDIKAGYKAYRNKETGKIYTFKEEPDKNKYEIFKSTNMAKGKTLKKQQKVTIGDRTINITDGYGVRGKDFKNREGQHSKGIDMTTDNDRVISLTDGVVEVASLDGSPTLVGTDKEQSGGYYLIIKNDDGTRSQYMHLDAMTPEEQKNIIGKRVKRGDDLGGYGVGSGSGTGPHIKYRVFTGDVGTQLETHIDPSTYISGSNKTNLDAEPNFDIRSSTDDKKWVAYLKTTNKDGDERDRLLGTYNKSQYPFKESINVVTIGDNQYVVASERKAVNVLKKGDTKTVEEKRISNSYKKIKIGEDGSVQTSNIKDKTRLYTDEIENIIKKEGVTKESVEKARQIFEQSENDLYQEDKDHDVIGEVYENKARIPFIEQNIENAKVFAENKLNKLNSEILTAKPEDQKKLREQVKATESKLASIENAQNNFAEKVKEIRKNVPIGGYAGRGVSVKAGDDYRSPQQRERFQDFANLEKEFNKIKELDSFKDYDLSLQQTELDKKATADTGTSDTSKIVNQEITIDNTKQPDPNDMAETDVDYDTEGDDYIDKDYLNEQLAEIDKQLNNAKKLEEFTPDLSMLDSGDKYGNLIATAGDIGMGMIGLKGAMEEVPEYQKGAMFNAYTDEAYRQRNMGLTGKEMGLRKQLAERGFGYDVKNIRRLSGGSSGVALGNLGRAAGTLQNRYAQIAAEDSGVRRMNQQRFDRAASADETLNRRKFEDSFKVAMLNKEMGAQLVRDKMKNIHERSMFEKQYGKGSIYDELSREMLKGKQYNTHALKMAQQFQVDKATDTLKDRKAKIEDELNKANNQ
tara:strand:+ start:4753 stop:7404 length:2652 start_codon:yes stop_codon:yes gene_type:complete